MTSLPLSAQSPPAIDTPPSIAGFWRRLGALLTDCLILATPTLLFGLAMFRWAVSLGQAGRLIGFVSALLYFGLLNSRLGGGQTLGKRLLGIRVIDRRGNALSPTRSVLRFLVFAIPYFLNGLAFDVEPESARLPEYLLRVLLRFVVMGGLGAIAYLFVFNRRTRQSLHDLVAGSFVIRGAPTVIPDRLTTARVHLIVVGCWLALSVLAAISQKSDDGQTLKPLNELQAAIKTQLSLQYVAVRTGGIDGLSVQTGAARQSFLQVDAQPDASQNDLVALGPLIADIVLDRHPDLLGKQILIVQISRGFDLGIARWTVGYREALDAAAWRKKVGNRI